MRDRQSALFRGRHFRSEVIILCVRWYLRYPLSYRDLEEMMAERGLSVDHSTIARWVLFYALILNRRMRREMRRPNRSWRVDETYLRVAGKWTYLYRAIDSAGDTIDFMLSPNRDLTAAKGFLRLALSAGPVRPRVINVDGHPAYASAIEELKQQRELAASVDAAHHLTSTTSLNRMVLLQIAGALGRGHASFLRDYAATPKMLWTNWHCATASSLATQRI